ncbi:MAG: HDIG domain-containing protein [Syntrophomonadaceae bacterium]|nr:HDIG domain-containing protein [Syntrophomonadaceae bacterium]
MDKYRQFVEFEQHLLHDDKPSLYCRSLAANGLLHDTYPFTLLGDLQKVEQSPKFHPEGSVWEHTLLVVDLAAEGRHLSENPQVFMWAALLHDLGKARTTKVRGDRITAYDHDIQGSELAQDFLREFTADEEFINQVAQLVRWHMQILYVNKKLPFADIDKMLTSVPLGEIALLSLCDRLGRGNMNEHVRQAELANIQSFVEQCQPN